ncbi:UNVERIFIED_CONTAM: hypothetical protein O8I53_11660 [Campylobacter lari]
MQNNTIERNSEDITRSYNRRAFSQLDSIANKDLFSVSSEDIDSKTYYDDNNLQIYSKL